MRGKTKERESRVGQEQKSRVAEQREKEIIDLTRPGLQEHREKGGDEQLKHRLQTTTKKTKNKRKPNRSTEEEEHQAQKMKNETER